MSEVKFTAYSPFSKHNDNFFSTIGFIDPIPLKDTLDEHLKSNFYFKCPAFIDFVKNIYVIKSTCNLHFICDNTSHRINIINSEKDRFFDFKKYHESWLCNRQHDLSEEYKKDHFLFSISNYFIFYSKQNIKMSILPPFLHDSELFYKTRIIPGSFNINKWVRPIEIALETNKKNTEINVKRGDILCYVYFTDLTNSDNKIKLKKMEEDEYVKIIKISKACTNYKHCIEPISSLKTIYSEFKKIVNKYV